jgi:hypothetical protein
MANRDSPPYLDDMHQLLPASLPILEQLVPSEIWAQDWRSGDPVIVNRLIEAVLRAQTAAQRRSYELLLTVSKSCWDDITRRKAELPHHLSVYAMGC